MLLLTLTSFSISRIFLFTILIGWSLYSVAQQPEYITYGSKDGMLSNDCYRVLQDQKGFIWVCSEKGVMKYDGYQFIPFTVEQGLPSNDVFLMEEDVFGRIWLGSFVPGVRYIENDEIKEIEAIDTVQGLMYLVTKEDTVFFKNYFTKKNYYYCWSQNVFGPYNRYGTEQFVVQVIDSSFNAVVTYQTDSLGTLTNTVYKRNNQVTHAFSRSSVSWISSYSHTSVKLEIEQGLGQSDSVLFYVYIDSVLHRYSQNDFDIDVAHIHYSKELGLIANNSDSILIYSDPFTLERNYELEQRLQNSLDNFWHIKLVEDREGNVWVSQPRKNIQFFPNKGNMIENHQFLFGAPPKDMFGSNEGLVITTQKGLIYHFDKKANTFLEIGNIENSYHTVNQFAGRVLISRPSTIGRVVFEVDTRKDSLYVQKFSFSDRAIINSSANPLGIDTTFLLDTLISNVLPDQILMLSDSLIGIEREVIIFKNSASMYFVAGRVDGELRSLSNFNLLASFDIPDIANVHFMDDGLLLCTNGGGLLYSDFEGNILSRKHVGICFNGMQVVNDTIYLASNSGIFVEKIDQHEFITLRNLGFDHGLSSNDIEDVVYDDSVLYALSVHGLDIIRLNELWGQSNLSPLFYLEDISVNNKEIDFTIESDFDYNQNNIKFDFIGLYYRNPGTLTYEYQLIGHDANPKLTSDLYVEYSQLPPGDYEFKIKAINGLGASSEEMSYRFHIEPHLFDKTWFKVLMISFIVFIFLIILYLIQQRRQRRIQQRKKLADLELKALRSQMNPHFIFNSLSSIQSVMFLKGEQYANKYIGTFSKLIRRTLDNSRMEFISLKDEFEYLQLYMELEKRRLNDELNYELNISEDLDEHEVLINTMLIQPLVENAIIHGLAPLSERDRKLIVSAFREEDELYILVEDNGVGRSEAEKSKSDVNHKSWASTILSERISTINSLNKKEISYTITDLYNENTGEPIGTRVTVKTALRYED